LVRIAFYISASLGTFLYLPTKVKENSFFYLRKFVSVSKYKLLGQTNTEAMVIIVA